MSRFASPPVWLRLCCVAALFATGCRSTSQETNLELLKNELRLLEDLNYDLEDELNAKEQQLEATKRENEILQKQVTALGKSGDRPPLDTLPPAPNADRPNLLNPVVPSPLPRPMKPEAIEAPVIEAPPLPGQQGKRNSPYRPAQHVVPVEAQDTLKQAADVWGPALTAAPSAVDHITIHPRLTGGRDRDRTPGDDGILVVFAPRDADERALQVRGSVQIALVDPTLNVRTARWEFSAQEADKWYKKSMLGGEAYHFELPWPTRAPEHDRQTVHVRFTTTDGNRHEADRDITLDLTGERRAQQAAHLAAPRNPRMTPNDDPPPAWNGALRTSGIAPTAPVGPALTAPPTNSGAAGDPPSIDIQIPDIGGVSPDGKTLEKNPAASAVKRSRLRDRRRTSREPPKSAAEAGPLDAPLVEAPAVPGLTTPPATTLPGLNPQSPAAAPKPAPFWRSLFQPTPAAQPSAGPAPRPRGFTIVPEGGAKPAAGTQAPLYSTPPGAPFNNAPSNAAPLNPAPSYNAPPYNSSGSLPANAIPLGGPDAGISPLPPIQTANERPEWKPYR
ncbi:MAG: hypothetical protein QM811_23120 [Pirellulales bacterium]